MFSILRLSLTAEGSCQKELALLMAVCVSINSNWFTTIVLIRKFVQVCGCHLPCSPCLQDSGMIQVFSVPPSDHLPSPSTLPVFLPSQAIVLHAMVAGRTRKESHSSVSVIDLHRSTHKTIHLEQKWGMQIAVHDMLLVWSMHVMYTVRLDGFLVHFVWESVLVDWCLNGKLWSANVKYKLLL